MEALGNYLGLDFDFFKAVSKHDSAALSRLNESDLGAGVKACYLSHYEIFESIIKNDYESALIFEDDVDIELNITDIMTEVHHNLPDDWDILYLGHCAERDSKYIETNLTAHVLHKSGFAQCLHGYAVTAKGAMKLIEKLNIDKPKNHVDIDIPNLVVTGEITSYSIHPQIVVQFKGVNDKSDISPGVIGETYPLMNSTLLFLGYDPNNPNDPI
ncbi:14754_t:CDS:1 [Racocetra fulgida]|uniref:14754_t:CDS:1 n=1 Tax=Racocetra fulgida TaxID=60492 RepID=A0A9N9JCX2_9GLOM|nr:14754_t:CDS:1 [Racocetra fulgida]